MDKNAASLILSFHGPRGLGHGQNDASLLILYHDTDWEAVDTDKNAASLILSIL